MFMKVAIGIVIVQLVLSANPPESNATNGSTESSNISNVSEIVTLKNPPPSVKPPVPSFKDEEKEIFDFINSMLRQILPLAMKGSSTNLSPKCTGAMMKVFGGVRKLSGWTLKLLDSMGKPASGILHGTSYSPGNYDGCLDISINSRGEDVADGKDEFFHGQFCKIGFEMKPAITEKAREYKYGRINRTELGKLKEMIDSLTFIPHTKNSFRHIFGLCLPSLCNEEDITNLLGSAPLPGTITLEQCESKEAKEVDIGKRITLGVLFLLFLIVVFGTIIDILIHLLKQESQNTFLKRRSITIAISFSVFTNTKLLFRKITNDNNSDIQDSKAIRGLAVLTVFCLIVYHTYLPPFEAFYLQASNLSNLERYLDRGYFSIITALPITIETLFLISGYSLTNKIWKSTWKDGVKEVHLTHIIFGTYIRLYLPFLFCIAIVILLPLVGTGPFWNDVYGLSDQNCQKHWWHHIVMINNFFGRDSQCLPHFWYIPCLMQLVCFSTIMLFIISRFRKLGIFLFLCVILGCHIAVGTLTYINMYPPAYTVYFMEKANDDFWRINNALPLNHMGTFAIGMAMGVILTKKRSQGSRFIIHVLGWVLSIGCMLGICLILLHIKRVNSINASPFGVAVFAAIHKPLFALAVSWVLYTSSYNYAGFIGHILSWSLFDPFYKMSYFAYLFHLVIISFHIATAREHFGYSHMDSIMRSLGYLCLSFDVAYLACMVIDCPVKSLRAALFPSSFRQVNITYFSKSQSFTPNYNGKDSENHFNGDISSPYTNEPKV